MTSLSVYLLLSHGSRDYRSQIALERLAYLVQQQLNHLNKNSELSVSPHPEYQTQIQSIARQTITIAKKPSSIWVETASLELAPYPLHERIQQIAKQVRQSGGELIKVIPLFLLKGVHVQEDIPAQLAIAQNHLGNSCQLQLCPYLGSYPKIKHLLAHQFSQLSARERILLSHGSRRPGANQLIEKLATELGARVAYWSIAPSLTEQIEFLAESGSQNIAIVPYFLFKGGITDAIAQQVLSLQQTHPNLKLTLGEPLGPTPELANLIVEAIN